MRRLHPSGPASSSSSGLERRIASVLVLVAVAVGGFGVGCTWVGISDEGRDVVVLPNAELIDCERIADTRSRVPRKVWFVPRRGVDVEKELETLARNEAALLGGNVVSPMGQERAGQREFAVYRCGD
jgi:hypothetical protein